MSASPAELSHIASSQTALDRRMVAHDLWPRRYLDRRAQNHPVLPQQVMWPTSTTEVCEVVRWAASNGVPVVPFGAGSGVCAGIAPDAQTVVVDLKRMSTFIEVDAAAEVVHVDAGMNGERFERHLNALGFTCGHFPSSIYCSTVGGWVAARGAGQLSSRYGKIEDMLVGCTAVDGRGRVLQVSVDDDGGPQMLRLLIGNEGGLCIFTRLTLRVHKLATHRWLSGFAFPDLATGLSALRSVMACGESPSVMRLYDPLDTVLAGGVSGDGSVAPAVRLGPISKAGVEDSGLHDDGDLSVVEGIVDRVEELALFKHPRLTRKLVGRLMRSPGWANSILDRMAQGSKCIIGLEGNADEVGKRSVDLVHRLEAVGATCVGDALGEKWLRGRHRVSYKMARTFASGGWVDTMEVACSWRDVHAVYDEVRAALRDVAVVMCHFSHAYVDGCSLYFTFAGGGSDDGGADSAYARYDEAWAKAMDACKRVGANVSHHHGVGRSKAGMLPWTGALTSSLRELKAALDPHGILNPGIFGARLEGAA